MISELVKEISFVPPGFNVAAGETLSDEDYEASENKDGLTDSVFQLFLERARDPNLSGKERERADAAMMMILELLVSTYLND